MNSESRATKKRQNQEATSQCGDVAGGKRIQAMDDSSELAWPTQSEAQGSIGRR